MHAKSFGQASTRGEEKRRLDRLVGVDRPQLSFAVVAAELLKLHAKKNSALTMKRNGRIVEKDLNPKVSPRFTAPTSSARARLPAMCASGP
ncbi:hypothetical protein ABQW67_15325, partial [Xanthomonas hortorum]|nr:hypothetical protein [Xanthomonas hortorum pv. vitians]